MKTQHKSERVHADSIPDVQKVFRKDRRGRPILKRKDHRERQKEESTATHQASTSVPTCMGSAGRARSKRSSPGFVMTHLGWSSAGRTRPACLPARVLLAKCRAPCTGVALPSTPHTRASGMRPGCWLLSGCSCGEEAPSGGRPPLLHQATPGPCPVPLRCHRRPAPSHPWPVCLLPLPPGVRC